MITLLTFFSFHTKNFELKYFKIVVAMSVTHHHITHEAFPILKQTDLGGHLSQLAHSVLVTGSYLQHVLGISQTYLSWQYDIPNLQEVKFSHKDESNQSTDFPQLPVEHLIHAIVLGGRYIDTDTHDDICFAIIIQRLSAMSSITTRSVESNLSYIQHNISTSSARPIPPEQPIALYPYTPAMGLVPLSLINISDFITLGKEQSFQFISHTVSIGIQAFQMCS